MEALSLWAFLFNTFGRGGSGRDLPSAGSFPKRLQQLELGHAQPAAWNSVWLPMLGVGAQALVSSTAASQVY